MVDVIIIVMSIQASLEDQPWYHGDISRNDAIPLLKKDGDYLVRFSNQQQQCVLTVMGEAIAKNFLIYEESSKDVQVLLKCICTSIHDST